MHVVRKIWYYLLYDQKCIGYARCMLRLFVMALSAHTAYLFLDPQTKSVSVNDILTVTVRINTEDEKVQGAEAWIDFDAT